MLSASDREREEGEEEDSVGLVIPARIAAEPGVDVVVADRRANTSGSFV